MTESPYEIGVLVEIIRKTDHYIDRTRNADSVGKLGMITHWVPPFGHLGSVQYWEIDEVWEWREPERKPGRRHPRGYWATGDHIGVFPESALRLADVTRVLALYGRSTTGDREAVYGRAQPDPEPLPLTRRVTRSRNVEPIVHPRSPPRDDGTPSRKRTKPAGGRGL